MGCVEGEVEEDGFRFVTVLQQAGRFGGEEVGRVAFLLDGLAVAVPVEPFVALVGETIRCIRSCGGGSEAGPVHALEQGVGVGEVGDFHVGGVPCQFPAREAGGHDA